MCTSCECIRGRYQALRESIIVADMPFETLHLAVRGMTCDNCARSVQRKLVATPGVKQATVDLQGGAATIDCPEPPGHEETGMHLARGIWPGREG